MNSIEHLEVSQGEWFNLEAKGRWGGGGVENLFRPSNEILIMTFSAITVKGRFHSSSKQEVFFFFYT